MDDKDRLKVLDGFRAVAILLVMCYHYFVRWAPPLSTVSLYPYGDFAARLWLFRFGYLGVELFFIISGFVISMTIFRCRTIVHFAHKRFARLFPTMLLCSAVTFGVMMLLPRQPFHPSWRDFFPSLTFTDPLIWSKLFHSKFEAIDGSYWSLFVEVKFYFWIAILYFWVGSLRFFDAVAWVFGILVAASATMLTFQLPHRWLLDFIFALDYLPWFVAGIGFYALWRDRRSTIGWLLLLESAVSLPILLLGQSAASLIASLVAMALCYVMFLAMLLRPSWMAWIAYRPIASIGVASYSLYLLHQFVGVAILDSFTSTVAPGDERLSALAVPALMGALIATSLLIYRFWEAPAKALLLAPRGKGSIAHGAAAALPSATDSPQAR